MTLHKIECFLVAAETMNFTKAAEKLYITQPVLSRQISSMEQELGFSLFTRNKKLSLTEAGEVLAKDFSSLYDEYQKAVKKAAIISHTSPIVVRIGIYDGQSIIHDPRIMILKQFQKEHSNIIKFVYSKNSILKSSQMLKEGTLDLVLGCSYDYSNDNALGTLDVCYARSYIVISKNHPLASIENPTLKDFQNERFLVPREEESPKCIRDLTACFKRNGLDPPVFTPVSDVGTRSLWLMAGEGVMVETCLLSLYGNDSFRFIDIPEIRSIPLSFIWKKGDNETIEIFIRFLKNNPNIVQEPES